MLHRLSLVVASGACCAVEVLGLLIVLASLAVEHKRSSCGTSVQLPHGM